MTLPTGGMPPLIDDELLSAYLDGQVTPAERATVDAAIAADPAARAQLADLRATVTLLRSLPQPAPRRTFILTPEQAAAIRPARVAWITRLFPTVAAASAVAAVLCLMLIVGDLATGGFSTKTRGVTARPAIDSVANATTAVLTRAAPAPTAAAPAATIAAAAQPAGTTAAAAAATTAPLANAAAAAPAGAASSARGSGAPVTGAAIIAPTATAGIVLTVPPFTPTAGSFAASNGALPATATLVANAQAAPPVVSAAPPGGATVTTESHRVPVALVRAGEIVLALLAIAGIALALRGWRAKTGRR
ncbi:MAG: anti-sigma factor family protein [Thermomicrobiales bacterium]